ncbi:hypothetical protein COL5a_001848 [Colletotrichum fioriniae]|uniref:uncharacterized protein n=1 Tax=Colletotrichum fioriniae TaxID=710243 RepID=UPI002301433D|nr:uncharacterized protein COL516b_001237 [Colletotrichum fioriniae]KAJ0312165.1 hypothetical protein COL516b_001237 [Colletotrichum fioriniae]KAJ0332144.1 hypothetical protein COL5a_001848 [Colletotrichum fioriniae]KAJ3945890.1 hypothetical protein N0V96_004238 [Colletotrichum fioriniae]
MSFRFEPTTERALNDEEFLADLTGGNMAVVRWKHTPDVSDFDDAAAFEIIRRAIMSEINDPQRLRKVAVEIAALLPANRPAEDVLKSVWQLFVELAQQTPSGNIAMLDLVVILDHLALSPRTTGTVTVDGFEQLSRLHGLDQVIKDCMTSPYQSTNRMETLTHWINVNAFASLLWSYNLIDGRDYAIQQLRTAFEDRRSSDASDRHGADARLMAAAQWAIHSCQRLYHLSVTSEATSPSEEQPTTKSEGSGEANGKKARKSSSSSVERWRCGPRFKGRAGFSFRRWEFWQQAFEEAKEFGDCGIETKIEAGAAAGMMEKVLYAGFEA